MAQAGDHTRGYSCAKVIAGVLVLAVLAGLVVARMGLDPLLESGWDQRAFVADVLAAIR
jgi:hypothetical protein